MFFLMGDLKQDMLKVPSPQFLVRDDWRPECRSDNMLYILDVSLT